MDNIIGWLSGWYNWPFLLPLAVGLIFILADLFLGGASDLLGLDADADVDVDFDADGDADLDGDAHGSFFHGLAWLGMGKVPISVLLETLTITFGCTGLLINAVASDTIGSSTLAFPVALLTAAVVAPLVTKAAGGLLARIVPADSTTTRTAADFVGEVGTAASVLTHSIGQIRLEATSKYPLTILTARLDTRVPGDVPRGTEVLLVGYDADRNTYIVTPTNLEL